MLPDMWDRTLSVHSGGKHFNVVGWRVGWAIGAAHLIRRVAVPHRLGCNCLPVYEQVLSFFTENITGSTFREFN